MPVFNYVSICCNSAASKDACVKPKAGKTKGRPEQAGLGHWNCDKCGRGCRVTRSRRADGNTQGS